MNANLYRAYRFFRAHAGWIVGENAKGALELAKAERDAKSAGLVFDWEHDQDPDISWMDEDQLAELRSGDTCMLVCLCRSEGGEVLASCGGIHVSGFGDSYCRVMEAELASEALAALTDVANPSTLS